MIRRAWLILSLAALFGAEAPLCVLACVEQGVVAQHHVPENAPCHGSEPAPFESPGPGQHECNCDSLQLVRSIGDGYKALNSVEAPFPPAAVAAVRASALRPPAVYFRDRHRSLPPPDILLLKATLLL